MKNILFIPIDNRPITYDLTEQIAALNKNLNIYLPKKEYMGALIKPANTDYIIDFIKKTNNEDIIILSLDTIAYGGLVSSRRSEISYIEIKKLLFNLKEILDNKRKNNPNIKIFATSSIMRISNNNVNEEEKKYWSDWGKEIFSYSYNFHKTGYKSTTIPKEILDDYLNTRKRNFDINKLYLDFLKENTFDFLIFSKDDTGEFGLNVMEANYFEEVIKKDNLSAVVKTGADEIPLGLLLKALIDKPLKIKPVFSNPNSTNLISRYEDISVKKCTEAQITLSGAVIDYDNPDIILFVNNFREKQGDLVFKDVINSFENKLPLFDKPYIIADINNANGSDNALIELLFERGMDINFLGYAGYNTSANTIGCALVEGITAYMAKSEGSFNETLFKKLTAIRLLDDWGYQANERINYPDIKMQKYEKKVKKFVNADFNTKYDFPWNRSFEIEVNILF